MIAARAQYKCVHCNLKSANAGIVQQHCPESPRMSHEWAD